MQPTTTSPLFVAKAVAPPLRSAEIRATVAPGSAPTVLMRRRSPLRPTLLLHLAARPRVVQLWVPTTPKVQANRMHRAVSQGFLTRRVEAIGATLAPRAGGPSAAEGISALAAHVKARSSMPLRGLGASAFDTARLEVDSARLSPLAFTQRALRSQSSNSVSATVKPATPRELAHSRGVGPRHAPAAD